MGGQIEGILGNWNSSSAAPNLQSGKIDSPYGARIVLTANICNGRRALPILAGGRQEPCTARQ